MPEVHDTLAPDPTDVAGLERLLDAGPGFSFFSGTFPDAQAAARLTGLQDWLITESKWRYLEWTDRMRLEAATGAIVPEPLDRFVHGRWFGPPGDLEAWRRGPIIRWRFIGEPGHEPPPNMELDEAVVRKWISGAPGRGRLWSADAPQVLHADEATLSAPTKRFLRYVAYYDRTVIAAVRYLEIIDGATG